MTRDQVLDPFAFEQITVSTTAVGFTAGTIHPAAGGQALAAYVTVPLHATDGIRYTTDTTTPTAAIGHQVGSTVKQEDFWVWGPTAVSQFRAIRRNAADVVISVTYYR